MSNPTNDDFETILEKELTLDVKTKPMAKVPPQPHTQRPPMPSSFGKPLVSMPTRVDGYEILEGILGKAYEQSAKGKGHSRHAHSPVGFRAWHDQPILANARQVGPAGPAQQVMKKIQEATMMAARGDYDAAQAEALGAIVYAAAFYQLALEMKEVK